MSKGRQDDLIDHPNGTKMLSNALVAVDDLSKTSSSYENKDSRVIVPSNYVFNSTYVFEQV